MPDLRKKLFLFFLFNIIVLNTNLFSQEVPQSVSNTGIYEFLDELANNHIIINQFSCKTIFTAVHIKAS